MKKAAAGKARDKAQEKAQRAREGEKPLDRLVLDMRCGGASYRQIVDSLTVSGQQPPGGCRRWRVQDVERMVVSAANKYLTSLPETATELMEMCIQAFDERVARLREIVEGKRPGSRKKAARLIALALKDRELLTGGRLR